MEPKPLTRPLAALPALSRESGRVRGVWPIADREWSPLAALRYRQERRRCVGLRLGKTPNVEKRSHREESLSGLSRSQTGAPTFVAIRTPRFDSTRCGRGPSSLPTCRTASRPWLAARCKTESETAHPHPTLSPGRGHYVSAHGERSWNRGSDPARKQCPPLLGERAGVREVAHSSTDRYLPGPFALPR